MKKQRLLTGALALCVGFIGLSYPIHTTATTQQEVKSETKHISLPNDEPYWGAYGGNASGNGTINGKTAIQLDDLQPKETILPQQFFEPVIVGDSIYTITDCKYLTKYDAQGNELARTSLQANLASWISARMAYGDGKIFVAVNGRIKAYDAQSLQPLWQSVDTTLQINGGIVYHNGYIYAGGSNGSFNDPKGYFFAIKTKDEDQTQGDEEKTFAWRTSNNKGYYWSSGVIVGNAIVFAGDDGVLTSHHLTQDITFDTYDMGEKSNVRSNLVYMNDAHAVVAGTQGSKRVYKMPLHEDGSFQKTKLQTLQLDCELTGGIAYYKDRIYASSGGMAGKALQVIDAFTMQVIYSTSVNTQSYPLITTAYATPQNNYKIYLYVIDFHGGLVILEDAQGQTTEKKQVLKENFYAYNSNSILGDINGNLYVYNGFHNTNGNRITIYANKQATLNSDDINRIMERLQVDNITYANISEVEQLQLQFASLSNEEQTRVHHTDLQAIVAQKDTIIQDLITNITNRIQAIPAIIATSDIPNIEKLYNDYGAMRDCDRKHISNAAVLEATVEKMYTLTQSIEQLIRDIAALDVSTLTLQDKAMIQRLQATYDALHEVDRVNVTNVNILIRAQDKIKQLEDALLVEELIKQIQKLPEVITLDKESDITALYTKYQNLHKQVQPQVTNVKRLKKAYDDLTYIRQMVDQLNDDIWKKLNPQNITLQDETIIISIMQRYATLSNTDKAYVKHYEDVIQANAIVTSLHKGMIPKAVFTNMKGMSSTYTYEGEFQKQPYKFWVEGNDIQNPMDVALGFHAVSKWQEAIYKQMPQAYILHMKHEGALPGKMHIQVYVPIKDGTYPLYTYQHEKQEMQRYKEVVIKDHQATYTVEQGGVYVLNMPKAAMDTPLTITPSTSNKIETNGSTPNTSDLTQIQLLWLLAGCSLSYLVIGIYRKNVTRNKSKNVSA